jgi:hypothetical protein
MSAVILRGGDTVLAFYVFHALPRIHGQLEETGANGS